MDGLKTCREKSPLRHELDGILSSNDAQNNISLIFYLHHEMEKPVLQNEIHWNQRARVNWLAHGDGNKKKKIHSFASERKRVNHLKGLVNERWQIS